jgi:hypothetical protein
MNTIMSGNALVRGDEGIKSFLWSKKFLSLLHDQLAMYKKKEEEQVLSCCELLIFSSRLLHHPHKFST